MEKSKEVLLYVTKSGKNYIKLWLEKLDSQVRARILNRITRLEYGIYGDYKHIENNILELRFFFGSGYRIYFTIEQDKIIILFNGGDKSSQQKDIDKARELMNEYIKQK